MCLQSKSFENTVKKREIARNEQFLLLVTSNFSFPNHVFYPFGQQSAIFIKPKLSSANSFSLEASRFVLWERVTHLWARCPVARFKNFPSFLSVIQSLTILSKLSFENIVENAENVSNQHFLLFPDSLIYFPNKYQFFIHMFIFLVFCKLI